MDAMDTADDLLGPSGPLAERLPGFAPRRAQQEMAAAVECALEERATLVAEAGTGTGKTYAYLVPALLSGRKVIVSTGTKNLQDQLYGRDLPAVRDALAAPVSLALLKGRANYLCLHRLGGAQGLGLGGRRAHELGGIRAWAGHTQSGDIAEYRAVSEDSPVWLQVTSTPDNCLGTDCPQLRDCFLAKARRRAQEAEVVVVNHHLLLSDLSLREGGFGEVLPAADAFIIDEAHQLPDVAAQFFGTALGANQLLELGRDSVAEYRGEAGEGREAVALNEALAQAVQDLRGALGAEPRRLPWAELGARPGLDKDIAAVQRRLDALAEFLEPLAERGKGLESCARRAATLAERFGTLTRQAPEDHVHWLDVHPRSFSIHLTPLEIGERFRAHMEALNAGWVFTSATLAVGGRFDHFLSRLGIEEAETRLWESPFDFPHQSLLYLPDGIPEPSAPEHTQAVIEAALPVLRASGGRAFLLFTSHRALSRAAELLREQIPYPLMVQGEAPRDALLGAFREAGNAVLLGTSSFWEGVDVRGEALSLVIIDKLPFAAPGDPVLQARLDAMRRQGRNPFGDYQLPQAVITLKQGVGRLIRDVDDRGVMMICDPRLVGRGYGRVFLNSLPPMPRTRQLAVVQRFFSADPVAPAARGSGAA